ncbi:amino acid-binding ACT domain protein [Corynebacterium auriscanis]|uniref:amino acid-binding ACT domain protein n=1 Tax=Corynebacterium auriscanis TaxID=99807 RepID=UPI0022460EC4|nr:amino acid-binding ACT domain protein [Corynebacterium auriscanis]MCX2162498.1 amino acid-binding ACT domain protein [Corynebacterium auriscanis]
MSYLMRVRMPDVPGVLGKLAVAIGTVGGDIRGVDIVGNADSSEDIGTVVDDIVVNLPTGSLPDSLITAAQEVDGVYVDSIRPFSGTVDRRGQVKMLADVADKRKNLTEALDLMMNSLPQSMTAGWSIVLDTEPRTHRVAASSAAPADNGKELEAAPVVEARVLNSEREDWIPENWAVMDSALAATPIQGTSLLLVIGRPGGPDFLLSEVEHLRQMGTIVGAFFS